MQHFLRDDVSVGMSEHVCFHVAASEDAAINREM